MTVPAHQQAMRNHWWWRPGWRQGRSFYTWHLTFADQPAVEAYARHYAPVLAQLPKLDPVSTPWLHLTLQGVGFTDEVTTADLTEIVTAAQQRCAAVEPFTITLGPAITDPETIQAHARPADQIANLRSVIRSAIADVWGNDNIPEPEQGFTPHVTLGYSNGDGPMQPVAAAMSAHPQQVASATVTTVSLIDLNRDNRSYEWTNVATVDLATQAP